MKCHQKQGTCPGFPLVCSPHTLAAQVSGFMVPLQPGLPEYIHTATGREPPNLGRQTITSRAYASTLKIAVQMLQHQQRLGLATQDQAHPTPWVQLKWLAHH